MVRIYYQCFIKLYVCYELQIFVDLCILDVDECFINFDVCYYGSCINLVGSYRCECDMGFFFILDGKDCRGQLMEFILLIFFEIKEI